MIGFTICFFGGFLLKIKPKWFVVYYIALLLFGVGLEVMTNTYTTFFEGWDWEIVLTLIECMFGMIIGYVVGCLWKEE